MGGFIQDNYFWVEEAAWGDLIFVGGTKNPFRHHGNVEEGLPFSRELSLENSADSYLCFRQALPHSVSYFFFLYQSPSSFCMVFDAVSSNIDEVLSINPSANVFVFGDFNSHHKDWLNYSDRSDRPSELSHNFSISNDLTQVVNFPSWIPDCHSHSPALLGYFFLLTLVCSAMAFPALGNSDHLVSVSIGFPSNSKQHCIAYDYFRADLGDFHDHLRDAPWESIFKLGTSFAANE